MDEIQDDVQECQDSKFGNQLKGDEQDKCKEIQGESSKYGENVHKSLIFGSLAENFMQEKYN